MGRPCVTCKDYSELSKQIREVLEGVINGDYNVTIDEIYEEIIKNHDYQLCIRSLKRHIRNCESDIWELLNE